MSMTFSQSQMADASANRMLAPLCGARPPWGESTRAGPSGLAPSSSLAVRVRGRRGMVPRLTFTAGESQHSTASLDSAAGLRSGRTFLPSGESSVLVPAHPRRTTHPNGGA